MSTPATPTPAPTPTQAPPVAPAQDTQTLAQQITGLPPKPEGVLPATGTVSELLSLRRARAGDDAPEEPDSNTPEGQAKKEELIKAAEAKLQQGLFKAKKAKAAKTDPPPAPAADTEPAAAPTDDTAQTPPAQPDPKPKQTKKVVAPKGDEVQRQLADLERQRLELEKQKLELEKQKLERERQASRPPEPVTAMEHLSPEERYEYEVFQKMSALDPQNWGNLPARFLEVAEATAARKAKWEKDNPGQSFNPDDEEHDDFFAKNRVSYDKKAFRRAEHKLATEGEEDPRIKEIERQNRELRAKEKLRDMGPNVANTFAANMDRLIASVDEDIAKVARESGRKGLEEKYPDEAEEILHAAGAIEAVSTEAWRILESDGLVEPDLKNPIHAQIINLIRAQEGLIPRQPPEDRRDSEGRDFATWEQWLAMSEDQRQNHWHMGAEEVADLFTQGIGRKLKERVDKLRAAVDRKVKAMTQATTEPARKQPAPTPTPAPAPGSARKSTIDTPSRPTPGKDEAFAKMISSSLFRRSS